MCKEGKAPAAYAIVKKELDNGSQDVWTQRAMGWVLYYIAKDRIIKKKARKAMDAIEVMRELNMLTPQGDSMLFDNILWEIRSIVEGTAKGDDSMLDSVFDFLSQYTFAPSKAYSALVKTVKAHYWWDRLVEFYDWWNFDNLMPEDYLPFKMDNGKSIMSLAEQVYISYARTVIHQKDEERIKAFIPKIETLAKEHSEMAYPGYFCGKLLMTQGGNKEETLAMVIPFLMKKRNEFWAWQLLGDVFKDEPERRLACLLRAVHCKCDEAFLTKIRAELARIYRNMGDYPRAHYHLDKIVQCCAMEHRQPAYEVQCMLRETLISKAVPDDSDSLDYRKLTDEVIQRDMQESIAVVVYVDYQRKYAIIVYGQQKRSKERLKTLGVKVVLGTLLKIRWMPKGGEQKGIDIYSAEKIDDSGLEEQQFTYIRKIEGTFMHKLGTPYAFLKRKGKDCFVPPFIARNCGAGNGDSVTALAVLSYNDKKGKWDWVCVTVSNTSALLLA